MALCSTRNIVILVIVIIVVGLLVWYFACKKKKEGFNYAGTYRGVPVVDINATGGGCCANSSYEMVPSCGTCSESAQPSGDIILPDVNTEVPVYDIDVADPQVFLWRPSVRVQIKNRQLALADPLRGDLAITKGSCHEGWFNSQYGEGDIKLDAYFSEFSNPKFRALTGQNSFPMAVSNEELLMC